MNAPRHDPEELKAALDAFAEAERVHDELKMQREQLYRKVGHQSTVVGHARERAAKALKREGGAVTYGERFWKVDDHGYVTCEPVRVNLDAIDEVKKHKETALILTPGESEKAA